MKKPKTSIFKNGKVAIVGRPNVGKSTLLNAILGHKVAITSPKPQTTRSQIMAFYEDDRGQMFFLDTPGFYASQSGASSFNAIIAKTITEADIILYVIDHTRNWGEEDTKVWNKILDSAKPTIMAINKADVTDPDYTDAYMIHCEDDLKAVLQVSALNGKHIETIKSALFELLPEGERDTSVDLLVTPLMSMSSKEYIAELVREKIYLHTGQEVPYQTRVQIDDIDENEENTKLKIKGRIIVNRDHYKPMLIGANGQKIKQISSKVAKELQFMTSKHCDVKLMVEVEK